MSDKLFIIANPMSGSGKGKKHWPQIEALLKEAGLEFEQVFTGYSGHAVELIKEAAGAGFRKFIMIGGDGSVNEAVNGIMEQQAVEPRELCMGLIPVGMGNDWRRTMRIPTDYRAAVDLIKSGRSFTQGVGVVACQEHGQRRQRYFANIAGMGYDAFVVQRTSRIKTFSIGRSYVYLVSVFLCLLRYQATRVSLTIDGESRDLTVFSMNVGLCNYSGGGMMQVPHAVPDSGRFGITIIKDMGVLDVLKNLKKLYQGTFIEDPKVDIAEGKKVVVDSDPPMLLEIDGEMAGTTPLEFGIMPDSLRIMADYKDATAF